MITIDLDQELRTQAQLQKNWVCLNCGQNFIPETLNYSCPQCGSCLASPTKKATIKKGYYTHVFENSYFLIKNTNDD